MDEPKVVYYHSVNLVRVPYPAQYAYSVVKEWQSAQGLLNLQAEWYCPNGIEGVDPDKYTDFVLLSDDCFSVPEEKVKKIESVLTIVDSKPVYGTKDYKKYNPRLPTVIPDWSPVKHYGGF